MSACGAGPFREVVAVVTGAGSGIGLATVLRLLEGGAKVVGGDVNGEALGEVAEELDEGFIPIVADMSSEGDVEALVEAAMEAHGRVDAGFNVAGIGEVPAITEMPAELWDWVLGTILKGMLLAIKHEARAMATRGGGAIVNVTSINCRRPTPGLAAYATVKAGIETLARTAAAELGDRGIRVNALSPRIAVARGAPAYVEPREVADPHDIAASAAFLATDEAAGLSGANLLVDSAGSLIGYPSEVPAGVGRAG